MGLISGGIKALTKGVSFAIKNKAKIEKAAKIGQSVVKGVSKKKKPLSIVGDLAREFAPGINDAVNFIKSFDTPEDPRLKAVREKTNTYEPMDYPHGLAMGTPSRPPPGASTAPATVTAKRQLPYKRK